MDYKGVVIFNSEVSQFLDIRGNWNDSIAVMFDCLPSELENRYIQKVVLNVCKEESIYAVPCSSFLPMYYAYDTDYDEFSQHVSFYELEWNRAFNFLTEGNINPVIRIIDDMGGFQYETRLISDMVTA